MTSKLGRKVDALLDVMDVHDMRLLLAYYLVNVPRRRLHEDCMAILMNRVHSDSMLAKTIIDTIACTPMDENEEPIDEEDMMFLIGRCFGHDFDILQCLGRDDLMTEFAERLYSLIANTCYLSVSDEVLAGTASRIRDCIDNMDWKGLGMGGSE